MGLIRFIFTLMLIYLLFRLLGKYVFPLFAKRYVNKQKKEYYRQNPEADPNRKEGDIHIKRSSDRKKQRVNADAAEYVDYEEVDDSSEN